MRAGVHRPPTTGIDPRENDGLMNTSPTKYHQNVDPDGEALSETE
jgi:hypothetical protein